MAECDTEYADFGGMLAVVCVLTSQRTTEGIMPGSSWSECY